MVLNKPLVNGSIPATGGIGLDRPEKNNNPGSPKGFDNVLGDKIKDKVKSHGVTGAGVTDGIRFSNHALERMTSRGISFKPEDMVRLNEAIEKAADKGSKETLVLMGDNALIVSVKNKTVVTTMGREAMKENVFTNIDSTVIL